MTAEQEEPAVPRPPNFEVQKNCVPCDGTGFIRKSTEEVYPGTEVYYCTCTCHEGAPVHE